MGLRTLPLQTRLDHRATFVPGNLPLYPPADMYVRIGGVEAITRLVNGLYDGIEADPLLRPAFQHDLTRERENQKRFFTAWLGGAPTYFDASWRHGLQNTHQQISISRSMAGRWVGHFLDSLAAATTDPRLVSEIKPFVTQLAMGLVNRTDEPAPGERLRGSCSTVDLRVCLQAVGKEDTAGIAASALPHVLARYGPMLLLTAAVRGKARAAEALLREGVDVNAPAVLPAAEVASLRLPCLPVTPLCGALALRREAVVALLLREGAQYDIFSAATLGDQEGVANLLDLAPALANADDPATDVARITPLMHAVFAGQQATASLLLQRGALVGANSVRLIESAANTGDTALVDLLLAHGADAAPLGVGPWVLYPTISDTLRSRGANVNRDPGAWIGLCCTGNSGHRENAPLARALLRYGADVDARYRGRTALHAAAKAGFTEVAAALVEYGADVNAPDDRGRTPLDALAEAGKSIDTAPMRRLLIARGATI